MIVGYGAVQHIKEHPPGFQQFKLIRCQGYIVCTAVVGTTTKYSSLLTARVRSLYLWDIVIALLSLSLYKLKAVALL